MPKEFGILLQSSRFFSNGLKEPDTSLQLFEDTHLKTQTTEERTLEIVLNFSRNRPNILINNRPYDIPSTSFDLELGGEELNLPGADAIHISITRDDFNEEDHYPEDSNLFDTLVNRVVLWVQRLAQFIGL
ncbi:MAG: hypothetical protein ACI9S8_000666 [Chlamydiales bacterium]